MAAEKLYKQCQNEIFFEPLKILGYYVGMSINLESFHRWETGTTYAGVHDDFSYFGIAICESRYSSNGEEAGN